MTITGLTAISADADSSSGWRRLLLRGGRTAKHRGAVGGIAPRMGFVSSGPGAAAMLVGVLSGATFWVPAALAGDCGPAPTVVCSGPAGPGDLTQDYDVADENLTITTEDGFGLDVTGGYGIIGSTLGTGDLRFIDEFESSIRARDRALDFSAFGVGEVEIVSTGELVGEQIYGLYLGTAMGVTSSTIEVNRVESERYVGIWVENQGGMLSITSTDEIIGGSVSGSNDGLVVSNYGTGGVFVDVNDVSGSRHGLTVSQVGAGIVSIKSSGKISGGDTGMDIDTAPGSTEGIDIDVTNVSGSTGAGSDVNHQGSGDASIVATGLVEGGDTGIYFENTASGEDVEISARDVTATYDGIQVFQNATGAVDISSTGKISSANTSGIQLIAEGAADPADDLNRDITIEVNDIEGAYTGILVEDRSGGDVHVTTTGDVVATAAGNSAADAISVVKNGVAPSGDIYIDVVDVTGDLRGILARNEGSGDIHVTATGTVTGINSAGINTQNFAGDGDVIIETNDTQGGPAGIWADSNGTGELRITSTGTASSTGSGIDVAGIRANHAGAGLDIEANNATGEDFGVFVNGAGTGTVDIDITGTATGSTLDGVYVDLNASAGTTKPIDITVNNATGGRHGIFVNNAMTGLGEDDVTITVTGEVEGGAAADSWGIWANNYWAFTQINVKDGARVGSLGGNAIMNVDGDSHVVVEDGATVNGRVYLGWGDDKLDLYGGFTGITSLDGDAGTDTLNLFDAADASYANNSIINWDIFNISGSNLKLAHGQLTVGAFVTDLTTGIYLTNGSTLDVSAEDFSLRGNLNLAAGTDFVAKNDGTGFSTIYGQVKNAGAIHLEGGGAGDTLSVLNYVGDNGTVVLDVELGNDSSAADMLQVLSNTSGTSFVRVDNSGGLGAQTVEGIRIIDVFGASDGAFTLDGDYVIEGREAVIAGAYGYTLWQNGITDPADGDWYLRSQLLPPDDPTDPPEPLFQPGVPIYEAYGQVLLALNGLPTLQQRVGNRYWSETQAPVEASDETNPLTIEESGVWGIVEASHAQFEPSLSTSGTDYDLATWRLRAGIDGVVSATEDGKFVAGFTGVYGHGSADISSAFGTGSIDADTWGFGVTGTWYADSGFYLDGQAQLAWFSSDLNSDWVGNLVSDNGGFGYALSLEAGQRVGIVENWTVIPQAQLIYASVSHDGFNDPFDAAVSFDGANSLRGRLGIAIEHQNSWINEAGKTERLAVHGLANLEYEFLDGISTDVSRTELVAGNDALWGEIGVGGSYNWDDDKYSVYGQVSASTSLDNFGDSYSLGGKAGLRVQW